MKKLAIVFCALFFLSSNAQAKETITVVGSSTVYPFSTVVAERFGKDGKNRTPIIESTGTGGGMKLFCAGVGSNTPSATNASRAIKDKEVTLCKNNNVSFIELAIGNDGCLLYTSPSPRDGTKSRMPSSA